MAISKALIASGIVSLAFLLSLSLAQFLYIHHLRTAAALTALEHASALSELRSQLERLQSDPQRAAMIGKYEELRVSVDELAGRLERALKGREEAERELGECRRERAAGKQKAFEESMSKLKKR